MITRRLLRGMTLQGGTWGFVCGAVAVILFCIPSEILLFFGIANIPSETLPYPSDGLDTQIYGSMFFGALLSFFTTIMGLLGFGCGLLIGIMTRIFFFSQSLSSSYQKVIGFTSAGFGTAIASNFLSSRVREFARSSFRNQSGADKIPNGK